MNKPTHTQLATWSRKHVAAGILALFAVNFQPSPVRAQGTAFTYQGRLNDGSAPANGTYDLRFELYDNDVAGVLQGTVLTSAATAVSNGLFVVTVDFGNQFPGTARWLEIGVRTNGGGAFSTLSPRQPLRPTPYAVTAGQVVSGGLAAGTYGNAVTLSNAGNNFSGSFAGNGANVTGVDAATLGGLSASGFWQLGGNNISAGQFLGSLNNQPVELKVNGMRAVRLEPNGNSPNIIGGYSGNVVSNGFVGGFIGGGGGLGNPNVIGGHNASVVGGQGNTASGLNSMVGGGSGNTARGVGAIVNGGLNNTAGATYATVSGGSANEVSGVNATVSGGSLNVASSPLAAVGGGGFNTASGTNAEVAGGNQNTASGTQATVGGGFQNTASGDGAAVGGGFGNVANAQAAVIAGGNSNQISTAYYSVIAGGNGNVISANLANSRGAVIGGGENNTNSGTGSVIAGGDLNVITSQGIYVVSETIGGGFLNTIGYATHSAGAGNTADSQRTIAGGGGNSILAGAGDGTIGGGLNNVILKNGQFGTIPGGRENLAADYAFAAGYRAYATNSGSFVWADGSSGSGFNSTDENQFLIRAAGNVGINTNHPTSTLTVNGQIAATSLRSPGAGINSGTYAFTQRAVATNTSGNTTVLYNSLADGDANAILIVTHNWTADTNSTTRYNTKPVGVFYANPHWAIFNEDGTTMDLGRAFNVLVIKP